MTKEEKKVPQVTETEKVQTEKVQKVQMDKKDYDALIERLAAVEKSNKILYAVADKGRLYNEEGKGTEKKPARVKLAVYNDALITAWRTVKDKSIYHPTTGKQVGEEQEYEIVLLNKSGETSKMILNGYSAFSNARYGERVEAEIIARKEDNQGNWTFDLSLSDGRTIQLDSRFVN